MSLCLSQTLVVVSAPSCPPVPFLQEIGQNAVFVEGTTGTTDICQGQLGESIGEPLSSAPSGENRARLAFCVCRPGDCWLLAALSCLTMHPTQFVKVVPPGQSLSQSYAGIFYFRVSLCGRNRSHYSQGCQRHTHTHTDQAAASAMMMMMKNRSQGMIIWDKLMQQTDNIYAST